MYNATWLQIITCSITASWVLKEQHAGVLALHMLRLVGKTCGIQCWCKLVHLSSNLVLLGRPLLHTSKLSLSLLRTLLIYYLNACAVILI